MSSGSFGTARRRMKRNQLRMRDGDNCWLCGKPMLFDCGNGLHPEFATLDHVVPKSRGGTLILSNLRLAHGRCNKVRGDREAAATADAFEPTRAFDALRDSASGRDASLVEGR